MVEPRVWEKVWDIEPFSQDKTCASQRNNTGELTEENCINPGLRAALLCGSKIVEILRAACSLPFCMLNPYVDLLIVSISFTGMIYSCSLPRGGFGKGIC